MVVNVDQVDVPAALMESEEAARRLGVKLTTLYSYVSRGRLTSYPAPRRGRRLFDAAEVEALARRARGGKQVETRVATVTTAITQLRADGPYYRGLSAVTLAGSSTFERTAELLWSTTPGEWRSLALRPPARLGPHDVLRWAVIMAAARDRHRNDAHPELVAARLRQLILTLASVAAGAERVQRPLSASSDSVAVRLAEALSATPPRPALVKSLDAALVLLADHELATSTLAVRIAASTRATVYDAVLAGLGALGGPRHGGAGAFIGRMLRRAEAEGVPAVLDDALAARPTLPGFGHPEYSDGDPRAQALLARVGPLARPPQRAVIDAVLASAAERQQPEPNVDFALAALTYAAGLGADAPTAVFTVARLAGWGAHYLEELGEPPLRYRARAVYLA